MPKKMNEKEINEYKEFLKSELVRFYKTNNKIPTNRDLGTKTGYPSSTSYYKYFGDMRTALIESGLSISKDSEWLFEREEYTEEYLLERLAYHTDMKIKNDPTCNRLLTFNDMKNIEGMPSPAVYQRRFKSIKTAYMKIGIDYDTKNEELLIEDILRNYKELIHKISRLPNSREIDYLSKQGISRYSAKIYCNKFESLYILYEMFSDEYKLVKKRNNRNFAEYIRDIISDACKSEYRDVPGVYIITNKVNKKVYIGKASSLFNRLTAHRNKLNNNNHPNKYLQSDWNKYKEENFSFGILHVCDKELISKIEAEEINNHKSDIREFGYNILHGSENPTEEKGHSEETKAYLRKMKLEPVIQYDKDMNYLYTWKNIFIASNLLRLNTTCVSNVCRGRQKTTGGFIFKFKCDLKDNN